MARRGSISFRPDERRGLKKEKEYRISAGTGRIAIVTSDREDFSLRSETKTGRGIIRNRWSLHRIVLRLIRAGGGISICNCAKRVKRGKKEEEGG